MTAREEVGGAVGQTGKGNQNAQTSNHKIGHGDTMFSMGTVVNNTGLHI